MKIVDRRTFLELPEDTVFADYANDLFGELGPVSIKGHTHRDANGVAFDFDRQELTQLEWRDGAEFARVVCAAEGGASVALDLDCTARDDCAEQQRYAVWEPQDVAQLIERLRRCASVPPNVNLPACAPATEVLEVNVGGSALRALLCDTHTASALAHLSGEHCELNWTLNTLGSSADPCDECQSSPQRGDTIVQRLERAVRQTLPTWTGFYWARCTPAFREEHGADAFDGEAVVEYTGGPDREGCVEIAGSDLLFAVSDFEWLEGPIRRKP